MVWFIPLPDPLMNTITFLFYSFVLVLFAERWQRAHAAHTARAENRGQLWGECMSFLPTWWGRLTCVLHARQNTNAQAILRDWTDGKQFCLWIYFTDPHFLLTGYFRMFLKTNGKCQLGVGTHNCNSASQETGCELTASPRCREREVSNKTETQIQLGSAGQHIYCEGFLHPNDSS